MSSISVPNTFSANTTISSSEVNANFSTIYNDYNGSINASNLATDAVSTAKIADDAVTTDKIADATVAASNINFGSGGSGIWWEEIGRTTLGSAGDTITVSSLAAKKYLMILVTAKASGSVDLRLNFNNDTGSNYARRTSVNGGSDSTANSASTIILRTTGAAQNVLATLYVMNISDQEKLVDGTLVIDGGSGASNAPGRYESKGKWANTSAQISRVDITNADSGSFDTGSEVIVLGHN